MALVETPDTETQHAAPEAEFEMVRMPDGSVRAVPKSDIHEAPPETEVDEAPITAPVPDPEEHFYVHLANGQVLRVKASDLPAQGAGTNAPNGFWHRDGFVHHVIGIFPAERKMERK